MVTDANLLSLTFGLMLRSYIEGKLLKLKTKQRFHPHPVCKGSRQTQWGEINRKSSTFNRIFEIWENLKESSFKQKRKTKKSLSF